MKKFKIKNWSIDNEVQVDSISDYYKYIFIIAIILIPFDNLPYFGKVLGELSVRGPVYAFIILIAITMFDILKSREIFIYKDKINYILIVFLIWVIISSIANFNNILINDFKGRIGIEKLILQLFVVSFMFLICYITQIIIFKKNITLLDIRKYILYSTIPVGIYSFFELLNLTGIINFSWIIEKMSGVVHLYNRGEIYTKGIRSVTGEPSYFAMYSAFVIPWILSYVFTEKDRKKKVQYGLAILYLLILVIFSKSRVGYAIMFFELVVFSFGILVFRMSKQNKKIIISFIGIIITIFIGINITVFNKIGGDQNSVHELSVSGLIKSLTDKNNMSNVARLGMQKVAVNIGIDNALVGVGIGQYGFYAKDYVDENALRSNEVQNWINPDTTENSWPPAFSLYARIVAEQGILGIIIWITLIIYTIYSLFIKLRTSYNNILGLALMTSFLGVLISSFNADTFAISQLWILIAIIVKYKNE